MDSSTPTPNAQRSVAPGSPPSAGARDERYRPLFALSPQPAWVYDTASLCFLEVNEAAVRSYGWTRAEFLGLTLRDIRPPAELGLLDALIARAPDRERHASLALHRTKSGAVRRVEISSFPVEFDGHDARMVLVHDVTERMETEEALARSEREYRSLVEQLRDVFFRTDEQGNWGFLNPAWTSLTGHEVEASLGRHFLSFVHPADRKILLDAFQPLAAGSVESTVVEVRYFRADGGYRWVEATTHAVRDERGRFVGTSGLLRDVTARRTTDGERDRLARNVRQLLESSGEGIVGLDAHGTVTFINRRGSAMLGYGPNELVGRSMHEATHHSHPDGRAYPVETCPMQRAATEGIPSEVADEVLWRKDGIPLQVEYVASPVLEHGTVSGAVVNFRDTTARKRAELELIVARDAAESANRAKSDFLARMSHELRTPLNSIIGFANILLKNKRGSLAEADLAYLIRIASNGRHLLGLINDILDLSKIEAGHMTLELTPVQVDALLRATADEMEVQVRDKPVALRLDLPEHCLPIDADEARMRQVLVNLVGNAVKFTDQGEVVLRLAADDAGRPTLLEVRDTGIGIPSDRLDAIFNVFEQGESMITRRFGGTGLGLAIARSLCELMGHRLEVRSAEGEGTTMTVVFGQGLNASRLRTTAEHPVPPVRAAVVAAPDMRGLTALVVDDDAEARVFLSQLLEEAGCRVVVAATGVEALRLAREVDPAVIFLDLRLPRISGFDVLRILQADEALRLTPVIVASAVASDSRSALAGAAAILDKPLEREAVLNALRQVAQAVS